MSNEWESLKTMLGIANAQLAGWEIQVNHYDYEDWVPWAAENWKKASGYRGRPKQPKTKTITLRKALLLAGNNEVVTREGSEDMSKWQHFVRWLGEPYEIEVPDNE